MSYVTASAATGGSFCGRYIKRGKALSSGEGGVCEANGGASSRLRCGVKAFPLEGKVSAKRTDEGLYGRPHVAARRYSISRNPNTSVGVDAHIDPARRKARVPLHILPFLPRFFASLRMTRRGGRAATRSRPYISKKPYPTA